MTRTPDDRCFFVMGYGRSGTTLLRRMLSAHPELFVAPENNVFQLLPTTVRGHVTDETSLRALVSSFPPYFDLRIYDLDLFLSIATPLLPLSVPELFVLMQGASQIGKDKPAAQWGHKAPSEWPYLGTWRGWFPQARFLHLVRHPHDSTASMVEYQLQSYRTTPLVAIWQWRKAFRHIRRHGRELGPNRYLLLRYEALVGDPEATLASACEFLGVAASEVPRMRDFKSDPSAVHDDEGDHMDRTDATLTQDRIGRATDDYSHRQAAMIDHVCRAELLELGYQPRAESPVSRLRGLGYDVACVSLDAAWACVRGARRARGQL